MTYVYHNSGSFVITDDPDLAGWPDRFTITDEQKEELDNLAALSVVNGDLVITPAPALEISVTAVQMRMWLIDHDLATTVDGAFENSAYWPDEKTRLKAKTRWEFEPRVYRKDPLVIMMGSLLGMSVGELNRAFMQCSEY